jgi:hypothetical protein
VASPGTLVDAVLKSEADGNITLESGIRLIFMVRRAGEKGYTWWKRTNLAEHWHVHKTTITLDYARWTALGFVKLRANPFKASAKILIFPWSKVWDDVVWEDPEKVASMLPDLREAFGQKNRGGRMYATQKGGTDATSSMAAPLYENLESEGVKEAAARTQVEHSDGKAPRKPPGCHCQ